MANLNCPPTSVLDPTPKLKSVQAVFTLSLKSSTTVAFVAGVAKKTEAIKAATDAAERNLEIIDDPLTSYGFRVCLPLSGTLIRVNCAVSNLARLKRRKRRNASNRKYIADSLCALKPLRIFAALVCCFVAQTAELPKWAPFVEPDFPFFSSTLDARKAAPDCPTNNLIPR
jgi:hypothetical protein